MSDQEHIEQALREAQAKEESMWANTYAVEQFKDLTSMFRAWPQGGE